MKNLKVMFTITLSLIMCITMFTACQSSKPEPQSGSDTATTTTEATITTTEATTTTTTASMVEVKLNTEFLSCIGKTYAEISALYGTLVEVSTKFEGGFPAYRFENSSGFFSFGGQTDCNYNEDNTIPTDESGEWIVETAPLPQTDAPCKAIRSVPVKDVFLGLTEPATGEELVAMYNIEYIGPSYNQMEKTYVCAFIYEGLKFCVYTEADYIIKPNALIYLVKPTADW